MDVPFGQDSIYQLDETAAVLGQSSVSLSPTPTEL